MMLFHAGYKKSELARRFCLYYTASAISGALGGLLAGVITGHLNKAGGLSGWKWLFIVRRCPVPALSVDSY